MTTISEAFEPFLKPILMMLDIFLLSRLERVVVAGGVRVMERIPLWAGRAPIGDGQSEDSEAWISIYRPANANGASALICPGGSYSGLALDGEGYPIAEWLANHGITGIILEYRLPQGRRLVPLLDAQRAIRTIRMNAEQWGLDRTRLGLIGFSAGGHLASTAATHFHDGELATNDSVERYSCRPDFLILVYPLITMGPGTHSGSRLNLLGMSPSAAAIDAFSNEKQVTPTTPPSFLVHAADDIDVPSANSRAFYDALRAANVSTEYLELPAGGHGLGFGGAHWKEWQEKSLLWLSGLGVISLDEALGR
jgi:acetyl esterase/lipase